MNRLRNEKGYLKWPLIITNIYIMLSMAISFWGPMKYVEYDKGIVAIYMTLFLVIFNAGYHIRYSKSEVVARDSYLNRDLVVGKKLAKLFINITLLIIIYQFIAFILSDKINLSLSQIGKEYIELYSTFERGQNKSYSMLQLTIFLTYLPKSIAIILGMYYYKDFVTIDKIKLSILVFLMFIVSFLSTGQQKQLGDIVIYALCVLLIKMAKTTIKQRRKLFLFASIIGVVFILLLGYVQYNRYNYLGINLENYMSRSYSRSYYDPDNLMFKVLGKELGFGIANIVSLYMSGGYYGLSLCLSLPFVWTYGLGSSYTLNMIFVRIFGSENQLINTYPARMEARYGWPALTRWNTIFPWLASDFSFWGAILLFLPFSAIYSLSWKEAVDYQNPISIVLFSILTVGVVYIPANNQLFHSVESFVQSGIILLTWAVYHNRLNMKMTSE